MRNWITVVESAQSDLPATLVRLHREVYTKSWEAAKRIIVGKVGSVQPRERFDDDLADTIFLRIQKNAQRGHYDTPAIVDGLGREARRLDGDEPMTIYRAAPKGGGIRPGDFCAGTAHEAGFYLHGGHSVQKKTVRASDLIALRGSSGDGQEYVYLPIDHAPVEPQVFFSNFRDFWESDLKGA